MLDWEGDGFQVQGLDSQDHWYRRVTESTGIQPPTESPLEIERFPPQFRAHIQRALSTHLELSSRRVA